MDSRCTHYSLVISGVTEPKLTKFSNNVDKSSPLLLRLSTLQYSNSLWNACAKNEGGTNQFSLFAPKLKRLPRRLHLIHDLLFLPISTIQSAVGKRLITHCCISRLACSRLSGHIEPHSPDFKREINTTIRRS